MDVWMPPPDAVERTVMKYVPFGSFVGSKGADALTTASTAPPVPVASVVSPVVPARVAVIFHEATECPSGGVMSTWIVVGHVRTVPSAGVGVPIVGRASPTPPTTHPDGGQTGRA